MSFATKRESEYVIIPSPRIKVDLDSDKKKEIPRLFQLIQRHLSKLHHPLRKIIDCFIS